TTTTEAPEEEATTTEAPPEDMFTGSSEALKSLKSFRYLSLFKFEGEETAEIKPGSSSGFEIKAEYVAPDKEHAVWTDLSSGEGFEAIRIGDKGWIWMKQAGQLMEMPGTRLLPMLLTRAIVYSFSSQKTSFF
ncbi:unnamed protein product, partial [marine sediment metagenome]